MKTEELVAALRKDCRDCGSNSLCLNGEMNVYCAVRDAADRLEGSPEERRVGKERRSRWRPWRYKKETLHRMCMRERFPIRL